MTVRLRLAATRRAADAGEAGAALARLGEHPGIYFGVEGGVPGLHPLQATLLHRPALALRRLPGRPGPGRSRQCLTVLAGTQRIEAPRQVLAIGDAAALLLQAEGHPVHAIEPQHGHLARCTRAAAAPGGAGTFIAARSLRWRIGARKAGPGWSVWATDEERLPQVLVHEQRRLACFLFRPDSLLSQPAAVELLQAALALCAQD